MAAGADDLGLGAWRRDRGTVLHRGGVLPVADPSPLTIVAESQSHDVAAEWSPHRHPMHELVWVRGGTLTSRIGHQIFTVPDGFGMWLPAGVVHGGRVTAAAQLHSAFFVPERTPVDFSGPTSIAITPLLESLLLRRARTDLDEGAQARTEAVVFDVLEAADRQFALDLPGDQRIDAIAEALLRDPSDDRSLAEWAAQLGTSDRTITRAFRETTGLSFAQWRQARRIHEALALLSAGADVQEVSELLGYAQPSTFIAAFRRVMKVTPGAVARAPLSEIPYPPS
ncbi:helix-turn-helix transcriptional regulator [Kineosporia mesophila]|uniref:Helix-turn-helix transcriptional regulator n=1 Tax=Kineosporia mesophila TaxID=566012 RepID=A0ABP6Z8Z0_9ACTN|nr:AraC family transcriptional regulator [Kineosporia mesophila]MCD5352717.1 AraC family transcriptional regulator [Kineosporia mesophila]